MRFELTNARHWFWSLPTLALVVALWAPLGVALYALDWYGALVPLHAAPEAIDEASATAPSRIYSARGFVIGGLERGGAGWVGFDAMSDAFVRAIVASEDRRFFYHRGVDPEGIARAARANFTAGDTVQGGSTLTQQLAKSFVGDARTLERKLVELVVARRIEMRFDKASIFEAWANRAYFGAGAEGVGAAARIYFGVSPSELDLAQSALLAALVPAPGRYNPFDHPEAALERRDRVLTRLYETGLATRTEVEAARATPLGVRRTAELRVLAPDLERAVWHELNRLDPTRDWRRGGLRIDTGLDLVRQRVASAAIREHLYALDRRQGLRETLGTVALDAERAEEAFRLAWAERFSMSDEVVPALVLEVERTGVTVWAGEPRRVERSGWSWAIDYDAEARNHGETVESPVGRFVPGDLVLLHRELGIVQFPRVEGAYVQTDVATGVVEAQVGGFDPERSEFDRASQGCRQPGSIFKPIVYSAALDQHYTPATLLRDGPVRVVLGPYEEWNPRNADGSFEGHITLWQALIWSRNLPTLAIHRDIRAGRTIQRGRALGLSTPMDAVESLALGASCVRPAEMTTVYGSFARGGFGQAPRIVTNVEWPDRSRRLDGAGPLDPGLDPLSRTESAWTHRDSLPEPRINRRNAFQMAWLLNQVARVGTASEVALPFPFAGKTGTTNAYDAWFAGFTSRDVAVLWIGSDENSRPLGQREGGGRLALPAWADAVLPPDDGAELLPEAPPGIVWVGIEPESGRLAPSDRWSVSMPFVIGTEPRETATTRERLNRIEVDRLERGF